MASISKQDGKDFIQISQNEKTTTIFYDEGNKASCCQTPRIEFSTRMFKKILETYYFMLNDTEQ